MTANIERWERLCKTDPAHTKQFSRAGGFKGTAIKPIWTVKRMTEEFGPCGEGWGINEPKFHVEHCEDTSLVFCTVSVWHGSRENLLWGVGGDKFRQPRGGSIFVDDEAYKKAFTDAVGNAIKFLGVGADVHMGLFDDSKYVAEIGQEYQEAKSSAQLKRDGVWQAFESELADCRNLVQLEALKADYREKAVKEGWNRTFKAAMADAFATTQRQLEEQAALEAAE